MTTEGILVCRYLGRSLSLMLIQSWKSATTNFNVIAAAASSGKGNWVTLTLQTKFYVFEKKKAQNEICVHNFLLFLIINIVTIGVINWVTLTLQAKLYVFEKKKAQNEIWVRNFPHHQHYHWSHKKFVSDITASVTRLTVQYLAIWSHKNMANRNKKLPN